ncbi:MAG: epoxyalkane--coenzyme M transferase, partial [Pseudomonadota bacterium]
MLASTDRILTTHVGSLPRSQAVTDVLFARENNGALPPDPDKVIRDAVAAIVAKQVEVGVDVVSDGEMGKISYATYIKDRLSGFDGDTPRHPGQDLVDHPRLLEKLAKLGSTASYRRPKCVADIRVKNLAPMQEDIANMKA